MTMAVGIPNTGKSTLINALRDVGRGGSGGAARVGRSAGQTRTVGQSIVISRGSFASVQTGVQHLSSEPGVSTDDMRILMWDTPGILEPSGRTLAEQLSLCVCGAIDWSSVDRELLVDYLLFWWNHRKRTEYVRVLRLPEPTNYVNELLARVCAQHGFVSSTRIARRQSWEPVELESLESSSHSAYTRTEPDLNRAADFVLRCFANGDFGPATFTPSDEQAASEYFVLFTKSSKGVQNVMDSPSVEPVSSGLPENLAFPDLGEPPEDWRGWFAYMALKIIVYAAKDPWGFFGTILMVLTPLMMVSAYCAYKLAQEIKRQEGEKKQKAKRAAAIAKGRKQVKAD